MGNNIQRLNKNNVVITPLTKNDESVYWRSKTPEERLQALELNRSLVYGYGNNPPRIQKILQVIEKKQS